VRLTPAAGAIAAIALAAAPHVPMLVVRRFAPFLPLPFPEVMLEEGERFGALTARTYQGMLGVAGSHLEAVLGWAGCACACVCVLRGSAAGLAGGRAFLLQVQLEAWARRQQTLVRAEKATAEQPSCIGRVGGGGGPCLLTRLLLRRPRPTLLPPLQHSGLGAGQGAGHGRSGACGGRGGRCGTQQPAGGNAAGLGARGAGAAACRGGGARWEGRRAAASAPR
jgi:hypothetical protein